MTNEQKADAVWKAHKIFMYAYAGLCIGQGFCHALAPAFYASLALITASWALCGNCPLRIWECRLRGTPLSPFPPKLRALFAATAAGLSAALALQ